MSADKNHEQYLEEIETAVAETTKALMENEDYNLREAYRKIAQQDVEIKRLMEYQSNDRKTIRNLRAQLAKATEDISGYESICKEYIGDTDEYISPTRLRDYVDDFTDEVRELEKLVGEKEEEIDELQEKIENLEAINEMTKDSIKECKEDCDGGVYGLVSLELYTKATEELETLKQAERSQTKYWEGCILNAEEQIETLKKETWDKTQVDEIVSNAIDRIEQDCDALNQENKRLKKELDEYRFRTYSVWSDLYWADKYGSDVGWKDIACSCDYFDNEEFIKKEVVEDSDDEDSDED